MINPLTPSAQVFPTHGSLCHKFEKSRQIKLKNGRNFAKFGFCVFLLSRYARHAYHLLKNIIFRTFAPASSLYPLCYFNTNQHTRRRKINERKFKRAERLIRHFFSSTILYSSMKCLIGKIDFCSYPALDAMTIFRIKS